MLSQGQQNFNATWKKINNYRLAFIVFFNWWKNIDSTSPKPNYPRSCWDPHAKWRALRFVSPTLSWAPSPSWGAGHATAGMELGSWPSTDAQGPEQDSDSLAALCCRVAPKFRNGKLNLNFQRLQHTTGAAVVPLELTVHMSLKWLGFC